jgi:hypothetical protein
MFLARLTNRKTVLLLLPLPLLIAFALLVTTLPANACEAAGELDQACSNWRVRPLAPPTAAATPTPLGDRPETARTITDTWGSIDPHASIWFKTDDSTSYREIELWVDTPNQGALGLSILSPDQMDSWWNAKPVGRGSYNPGLPAHALTWTAAYAKSGVWYALLQNNTDAAVAYRLGGNITSTGTKSCHGYWETLNGASVYWIDCNPIHNPQ